MSRVLIGAVSLTACAQVFAQSTATRIEEGTLQEVVVEGTRIPGTGLMQVEQVPKSRATVSDEYLATQTAGQSVIQSLNLVPGVNFTNSDPYGSSGGNLRLRGFDNNRISLMLDGIQLNDTGNYAIFTNQQLDPEVIDNVTVNVGTSDVDSPTASATGGTINISTVQPKDNPQLVLQPSFGSDDYRRLFVQGDSGAFGPWGTTAFVAVSQQEYEKFKGPGDLEKTQLNARVYQDLGDDDFVSLAIHGNRNRNNFYRNLSKAEIAANGYDFDNNSVCARPTPGAGVQNEGGVNSCTNYYNVRLNPSDTANIRAQGSFGLSDSLRLTVDPSFQYVLANGGGYTLFPENDARLRGAMSAPGVDLNGDGDVVDTVGLYTPNNTHTRRFGLNSSLLWAINDTNLVRFGYTLDYGRHRQTAQHGFMQADGDAEDDFAGRKGRAVITADGAELRGRDRYSVARLNQVSVSYTGKMVDDKLHLNLGVRAPFFERELNQYCHTNVANGAQFCTTQTPSAPNAQGRVTFSGVSGSFLEPYARTQKYDKVLPNIGLSYEPWADHSFYVSYAKGFSAPRTDNLYNVQILDVQPETTSSYDLGYRYQGGRTTATAALWMSDYENRIVSAFDPELGLSVDRNVGAVDLWGIDMSAGMELAAGLSLYTSASYNNSEVQRDIQVSATQFVSTAGKELVETPEWTLGSRLQYQLGSFTIGVQGKYVDERWATDVNDEAAPSYTVFDADVRYDFTAFGRESYVQLNVINVADKDYLGSVATSRFNTTPAQPPLYAVGAPRTLQLTVRTTF